MSFVINIVPLKAEELDSEIQGGVEKFNKSYLVKLNKGISNDID